MIPANDTRCVSTTGVDRVMGKDTKKRCGIKTGLNIKVLVHLLVSMETKKCDGVWGQLFETGNACCHNCTRTWAVEEVLLI